MFPESGVSIFSAFQQTGFFLMAFSCDASPCPFSFQFVYASNDFGSITDPNDDLDPAQSNQFTAVLNDERLILVPDGSTVVSLATFNPNQNAGRLILNGGFAPGFADGFTFTLTVTGDAQMGINILRFNMDARQSTGSWVYLAEDSFKYIGPGRSGGDPHFRRWGQDRRDTFHGECDLVMLHSDTFHNNAGLDLHVRTTLTQEHYSYIEMAAIRIGEHVLEVHNGQGSLKGALFVDADLPMTFGDTDKKYEFSLSTLEAYKDGSIKRRIYDLNLDDDTRIEFRFYKHLLTFAIHGHTEFAGMTGVLGEFPSGKMRGRDGLVADDFIDFAFEWQVGAEDSVLFAEPRSPQLPYEKCRFPDQEARPSRRQLRSANKKLFGDAQEACSSQVGHDFGLCVDDVLMTGDVGLAEEW
jgi:hypothetical protein